MSGQLFLLDGMALVYRAHFALAARPIFSSKGVNTSALYVFTQTLLDILNSREPTHVAVAFDTAAPTGRHALFPDYKVQREAMPEDLSQALPEIRRLIEGFNIPILVCDGYEADDIIGTLVRQAEKEGLTSYMVTPDKDFGQLVTEKTFIYRPSRMGDAVEILGVPEVLQRWGVQRPDQIPDVMGLWGDASDNIPGVPGIGEKTAIKLIAEYGSLENLLANTAGLKGRVRENLEKFAGQARLSKQLATINCETPCLVEFGAMQRRPWNEPALKSLFQEFEFSGLGRKLFGEDFRAPRALAGGELAGGGQKGPKVPGTEAALKTIRSQEHNYRTIETGEETERLAGEIRRRGRFAIAPATTDADSRQAELLGIAISMEPHVAECLAVLPKWAAVSELPGALKEVMGDGRIEKTGHDLKFALAVLRRNAIQVRGKLFDTLVAQSLIEPEVRHSLESLAQTHLGYTPLAEGAAAVAEQELLPAAGREMDARMERAAERADLSLQLRARLEPALERLGQERVFYEIEMPLMPVLVDMELEGIRVDAAALEAFSTELSARMAERERSICRMAGKEFNVNSPRQLGEILFDVMRICEAPKRTRTGQYATDESTLAALASEHEIVGLLLEHRMMSKLKSTYADALPQAISPKTGRIHTTYNQLATATGRLNSLNPNLQNIPIRSGMGQEIRKAFIPRDDEYVLLSADYSQIELRIIAALGREQGLLEAFEKGIDIHTATAARVFGVAIEDVTAEARRKAKMVNYGIAYGISAFGLAQRLGISRSEGGLIIEAYFNQFPGIRTYMGDTVAFARENGYVETVTGRRRYIRDINSKNATLRNAAERNAINAPIQGTAADMIKMAMIHIHRDLQEQNLRSRMLLQVHDELVFDVYKPEEGRVLDLVGERMKTAIPLDVPVVVEMGTGDNWLEAH